MESEGGPDAPPRRLPYAIIWALFLGTMVAGAALLLAPAAGLRALGVALLLAPAALAGLLMLLYYVRSRRMAG